MEVNSERSSFDDSSAHQFPRIQACRNQPKLYQVDLSLPPRSRYAQICTDYKDGIAKLAGVYNKLLANTNIPGLLGWLAKTLLRKVYSNEETEEIRGIAKVTGMPIHLIVAYNTFLDLFSGCTSGGARLSDPQKMIHFRNLDWGMEPLRDLIIQVEYVLNGDVVARAVTYAGYIGVLTGVREGLSMSLNYRARIDSKSSTATNVLHFLLVLFGCRPSIASQLRKILLAPGEPPTLVSLAAKFQKKKASSCYLTFCSPSAVLVVEKDLRSAVVKTSDEFLAVTNHDAAMESWSVERWYDPVQSNRLAHARGLLKHSIERKKCMCVLWNGEGRERTRAATTVRDVKKWLRTYPIRNEITHFCCIMDPSERGGGLLWVETGRLIVRELSMSSSELYNHFYSRLRVLGLV